MNKRTNFILVLLVELRHSISVQIKKLVNITGNRSLFDSSEYKLATRFVNEDEGDNHKELKTKLRSLLVQINIERQNILNAFLQAADIKNYKKVFRFIGSTNEQVLVPVYTLCFSISAYIYDELFKSSYIETTDFLLSSLAVFILLSFILCVFLWVVYIFNIFVEIKRTINGAKQSVPCFLNTLNRYCDKFITWMNSKTRWYSFLFYIVFLFVFFTIFIIIDVFLLKNYYFMLLGIVIPYMLIGLVRIYIRRQKSKYTYLFVCGHYLAIVCLSILYPIIILSVSYFFGVQDELLYPVYDNELFKYAILLFVLLNGIVAPFAVPALGYRMVCWDAKSKAGDCNRKIKEWSKRHKKNLEEFCKNIPDVATNTP